MSSSNLVRTGGGLASAAAGILLLVGHLLNLGGDPEYGTVLGSSSVLAAHVLLVFALVALYAAQAQQSGLLGSLGMVLSVVGTTLASGVILVEIAGASGAEVEAVTGAGISGALSLLGGACVPHRADLVRHRDDASGSVSPCGGSTLAVGRCGVRGSQLVGVGGTDHRGRGSTDHLCGARVVGLGLAVGKRRIGAATRPRELGTLFA
jgi:hypothetical protein